MVAPSGNSAGYFIKDNAAITSDSKLAQAVFLERTRLLFSNIPATIVATVIVMSVMIYVNWDIHSHALMIGWGVYMLMTMVLRFSLYLLFRKNIDIENNPQTWVKLFIVATVLTALGWGFSGGILLMSDSLQQQMFITILLAGLSAGALATLSTFYSVFLLFTVINMTPLMIKMLSIGTGVHIATALLILIFMIFIITAASRMVKTIQMSISLRFQHDAALQDLAEKKNLADELNINLNRQINKRKIIETHLENSMSQLKATLESTTDGILAIDNNDQISNWNQRFIELFQIPRSLIEQEDLQLLQTHINAQLKSGARADIHTQSDDMTLLEMNDGRLIERYSKPQIIAGKVIGCVYSYRDATIRIKSETALQTAKLNAELANQQKSEFLSRISHELRTPLNAILGFSNLLEENHNKLLGQEEKDYVNHICRASEHLLNLIDDLLDISRIESGKLEIKLKSTATKDIVSESLAIVESMASEAHIQIISSNSHGHDMPYVMADHTRCKQALVNLLSNAIKYNQKNGSVLLSVNRQGNHVRFEVTDTGPGIAADQHSTIFQPFTRLKTSEFIKGTGIGLTITKRLIDAMNGHIGLISTPGTGSSFWFELPAAEKAPQQVEQPPEFIDTFIGEIKRPYSILYIEDEPLNQALVRSIIKQLPNTVLITANSAEEGIEYIRETMPDIILMDINLPGISGFDALKILQDEMDLSNTPVYAVSANAMADEIKRGRAAGFYDYLVKPINIDTTRRMLGKTLKMLDQKAG